MKSKGHAPLTIGFLGSQRRGSDPRALAGAFRSEGHLVFERSFDEYLPQHWRHPVLRVARKVLRPFLVQDYNDAVSELASLASLDFLLVFKGMLLSPDTLVAFRARGLPVYLFYPDVSFHDHDRYIPKCLPLYDHVFTTKAFHFDHSPEGISRECMTFVQHGADPEVHRPAPCSPNLREDFECDVSFVGCWSPKKEKYLHSLVSGESGLRVAIWGTGWERAAPDVQSAWRRRGAWGDELRAIYQCSRINLGLLSEAGSETESGDLTTARTWQIPSSGGFLLHEDTTEFREAFVSGVEAATFSDALSLLRNVHYFLENPSERNAIREAGQRRSVSSGYTYLAAARKIVACHNSRSVLNKNAAARRQ